MAVNFIVKPTFLLQVNIFRNLSCLWRPVCPETRALLSRRWDELPAELRLDRQVVGRYWVGCGFTSGAEFCSFGCTHCYLPKTANKVPLPSLAEARAQIDASRHMLGPGGRLQITGGDVVDAYWRAGRPEELTALVRYTLERGLEPMLMTHGQILLDHPGYLRTLVEAGGLRKISFHIDITQAGRPGYPIRSLQRESQLHPLRRRVVDLILELREATGASISAAHTITVTRRNAESFTEILDWIFSDESHADVFHTVSLLPEADVGRTRISGDRVEPDEVWRRLSDWFGAPLPRDAFVFGHPDCSSVATLIADHAFDRRFTLNPDDGPSRDFFARAMDTFAGLGGNGWQVSSIRWQALGLLLRDPMFLLAAARYLRHRARRDGMNWRFWWHVLRGRVRGINVVMHNFMDADAIRGDDAGTRQRLQACSFRGAVRVGSAVAGGSHVPHERRGPSCGRRIFRAAHSGRRGVESRSFPDSKRPSAQRVTPDEDRHVACPSRCREPCSVVGPEVPGHCPMVLRLRRSARSREHGGHRRSSTPCATELAGFLSSRYGIDTSQAKANGMAELSAAARIDGTTPRAGRPAVIRELLQADLRPIGACLRWR